MTVVAPLTAIVTAHRRTNELLNTLRIISECVPAPAEIIVHVDGGEHTSAAAVRRGYPGVRVIVSEDRVGPGGGRNSLMTAATHPIVASFDDDSYPVDGDYFGRILRTFADYPEAWVVDARIFHLRE